MTAETINCKARVDLVMCVVQSVNARRVSIGRHYRRHRHTMACGASSSREHDALRPRDHREEAAEGLPSPDKPCGVPSNERAVLKAHLVGRLHDSCLIWRPRIALDAFDRQGGTQSSCKELAVDCRHCPTNDDAADRARRACDQDGGRFRTMRVERKASTTRRVWCVSTSWVQFVGLRPSLVQTS
jgi:hypothetical protein